MPACIGKELTSICYFKKYNGKYRKDVVEAQTGSGAEASCMILRGALVLIVCRISELVERETEEYRKADPDPFDDRHPGNLHKHRHSSYAVHSPNSHYNAHYNDMTGHTDQMMK